MEQYQINFTVTFNPNKFSDADTIWDGPQFFAKYIRSKQHIKQTKFVMEKHPNKPTRTHLHGICYIIVPKDKALKRFDIITNISKWANAKCGNSKFTWNNCDWESDTYATYWDYCLKEDPHYYYLINRYNDTNEQTRSAPLIETIQRRV